MKINVLAAVLGLGFLLAGLFAFFYPSQLSTFK